MKKLTKMSLDELAKTRPVLTEAEMKSCRGGDNYEINGFGIVRFLKATSDSEDTLYRMEGDDSGRYVVDKMTVVKGTLTGFSGTNGKVVLSNTSDARQLFEFCAKNTFVEFG